MISRTAIVTASEPRTGGSLLEDAYSIHRGTIDVAQLVRDHTENNEIRALGKLVERNHERGRAELRHVAAEYDLPMAGALLDPEVRTYKRLAVLYAAAFDDELAAAVVHGDERALAVFGELAQPDNPPELRGYAYRMMQMLHVERDAAERVRTRLDGKP